MGAKQSIEFDKNADIALPGLQEILTRRTTRSGPNYSDLGQLTDQELVTINCQAHNVREASLVGLRVLGDLVSFYNDEVADLDRNGVGWLTKHLTETVEAMNEIDFSSMRELARRGFDSLGTSLENAA